MSATQPVSLPTFAVGGSIDPSLREILAQDLHLTSDASESNWVLYDGASQSLSSGDVSPHLDAGTTVVVLNPTDDHLKTFGALGGVTVSGAHEAAALERDKSGHYCLTIFAQASQREMKSATSGADAVAAPRPAAAARIGKRLAEFSSRAAVAMDSGQPSLYPPPGAVFGYTTVQLQCTGGISGTPAAYKGTAEDQDGNSLATNTFYVYLVNGVATPYYVVILKQSIVFGSSGMVANNGNARGWAMSDAWTSVSGISGTGTISALPPTSPDSAAATAVAQVNQTLDLTVNASGGTNTSAVLVSDGVQMTLTDWAVLNTSQPATPTSNWRFYQTGVWNPVSDSYPPSDWTSLFFSQGQVVALPAYSISTLPVTTYSVWSTPTQAASVAAELSGTIEIEQAFYFLLAPSGSTDSVMHMDVIWLSNSTNFTVALSTVAQPT
jgi:hypothetical protein